MKFKSFTIRLPKDDWTRVSGKVVARIRRAGLSVELTDNKIASELFKLAEQQLDRNHTTP